jgi:5-methylcytosine-specific restriction endonuclease McrA
MGFQMIKPRCYYCGEKSNSRDHFVPTVRGGKHHALNMVPACKECNELKNDMTFEEFMWFLRDTLTDSNDRKKRAKANMILGRLAPEMIPEKKEN